MKNERGRIEWVKGALAKLPSGIRILDAGAGQQPFREDCSHLNYVSQDFGKYIPKGEGLHKESWDYGELDIISDITHIPEPNGSFDAILCTEVFEHIPDPLAAIKEFNRLMKPGGTLLLTAPFASLTHYAPTILQLASIATSTKNTSLRWALRSKRFRQTETISTTWHKKSTGCPKSLANMLGRKWGVERGRRATMFENGSKS